MAGMLDQRDLFLLWLCGVSCLSVHELNEMAREALNSCFAGEVWVVGEIHGLKVHAKSGHVYFDLVEKASSGSDQYIAKVSCAFFKGSLVSWQRSLAPLGLKRFELTTGIEVKLKARVDLFVKEGRYQLIVSEIDPTYTLGAIARQRARTIEELKAKGLLEKNKALAFVMPPLNIGLITSRGSAAYQDFTSIIQKSGYAFRVTLFDAHMQGENTVREVSRGIRALEQDPGVDTIVIIRGGGARTDLFCFDDLAICTAVAECTKPVMTGIGHEIDLSVADMVAHTHFVTPTDVARFFVSQADAIWGFLEDASKVLSMASGKLLQKSSERIGELCTRLAFLTQRHTAQAHMSLGIAASSLLRKSSGLVAFHEKHLVRIFSDLARRVTSETRAQESLLGRAGLALRMKSSAVTDSLRRDLDSRHAFMLRETSHRIGRDLLALDSLERELDLMKPEETLRRGYSITLDERGKALHGSEQVKAEDRITSVLLKGRVYSVVYGKES